MNKAALTAFIGAYFLYQFDKGLLGGGPGLNA